MLRLVMRRVPVSVRGGSLVRMLRSPWPWLALLASQFALMQIIFGIQPGDGARNLHWATVVADDPGYLFGDPDPIAMIDGFVPDPPSLAPLGQAKNEPGGFAPWWGPMPLLLIAGVWVLTGSKLAMALVVPAAAGATVIATYLLGRQLFGSRAAMAAAVFTALFPLFYEFSVVSYSESISALLLLLALWAYLRERTGWTVVLAVLALLCKLNMAPIYCGAVGLSLLYRLARRREPRALLHTACALLLPLAPLAGWFYIRTGNPIPSTGVPMYWSQFTALMPDMLRMLFYLPWYGALLTLGVIGACVWFGLRSPRLTLEQKLILGGWLAVSIVTLLAYAATPSAGNSPRVVLPGLPALALLAAAGWSDLPKRWAMRASFYIVALFLVINVFISYSFIVYARYEATFAPVYAALRDEPRGYTLISYYWKAAWLTRQPVTWFESDRVFQRNILHNRENFARYTTSHHIRYAVVPRPGTPAAIREPLIQTDTVDLYGADVLDYLQSHARRVPLPDYDLYILPD